MIWREGCAQNEREGHCHMREGERDCEKVRACWEYGFN
jgi:hypothetical protein